MRSALRILPFPPHAQAGTRGRGERGWRRLRFDAVGSPWLARPCDARVASAPAAALSAPPAKAQRAAPLPAAPRARLALGKPQTLMNEGITLPRRNASTFAST